MFSFLTSKEISSTESKAQKRSKDWGLVEDPEEKKIVNRIKGLRKKKLSFRKIAEILNEEGHVTKRGGRWQGETVRQVLKMI